MENDMILKNFNLFVDSRDRNRSLYPNSNEFSINLTDLQMSYKNIHSIEVKNIILPYTFTGITNIPYLTLQIPEIETQETTGINNNLINTFAYIPINISLFSDFDYSYSRRIFTPPKASLKKLTFKFTNPDGTDANFGTDTIISNPVDMEKQVFIHLLIKVKRKYKEDNFII